ncbi:MAG: dTDP-4-dehydrorhamnose 3,5-epimerase [Flavobacteriales bacterium]
MVEPLGLEGLLLIRPRIFGDERGYFFEAFNEVAFDRGTGLDLQFVQDNESSSKKGVLRGLHFQLPPFAQGKLVRVVKGAALDVVVDIRPDSPTFGRHEKIRLDAVEKHLLWVPPGFAHGFLTLEDDTIFLYKCTTYYHQPSERTIRWDDPDLAIDWGIKDPMISAKDKEGHAFKGDWAVPTP